MAFGAAALSLSVLISYQLGAQYGSFLVLSLGHLILGVLVFKWHGGPRLTSTGIFFAGVAVFVGLAGLHLALGGDQAGVVSGFRVSFAIFLSNILLLVVRFWGEAPDTRTWAGLTRVGAGPVRQSVTLGVLLLVAGFVGQETAVRILGPLPNALAFAGVAALFVGASISVATPGSAERSWAVPAALVGFFLYLSLFFSGFGRLRILALVLTGVVFAGVFRPRPWHKLVLLIGVMPAIVVAGMIGGERRAVSQQFSVTDVIVSGEGLGSGTEPLIAFAGLVDLDRDTPYASFPRQYGRTFLDALVVPFPRALWPDKPNGFGFRLALLLEPQAATHGHSIASLAYGEWYVNFWWFGFLLMPFVLAWVLRRIDNWHHKVVLGGLGSRADLYALLVMGVLVGGVIQFTWAGLGSYLARSGVQALVLVPLWAGAKWIDSSGRSTTRRSRV